MSLQRKLNVKIFLMFIVAENTGSVNIMSIHVTTAGVQQMHFNKWILSSLHSFGVDVSVFYMNSICWAKCLTLLSPRNALWWGYSNAAVVPFVRLSVRPCVDFVNPIETKPLCASSANLVDMFTMMRGWTLLILEVKGQGHNWHIWKLACEGNRD